MRRIEAALARIARASEAPATAAATPANVLALVEKHERLREMVGQALADLDAVITEIEK